MSRKLIAVALTSCALVACGGGGGGGDDTTGPAQAEGIWAGPSSAGTDIEIVILDDGSTWGLVAQGNTAFAVIQAPGSSLRGDTITLNNPRFYEFGEDNYVNGNVSARVTGDTLAGTATGAGQTSTFTLARQPNYRQAVTTAAAAGTWTGSSGSLAGFGSLSVTIQANGSFTAQDGPCLITGSITPRAGVAVFNMNGQYQASSSCPVNFQLTGIAVPSGSNKLLIGAVLPDRSDATLAIVSR
ncbi:MAG: hypothetical protein EOP38_21165 [Rubrivivax sp.]|nr:MAG: hypothetical protein EOP38_21165 [Rubrivivax sp.]